MRMRSAVKYLAVFLVGALSGSVLTIVLSVRDDVARITVINKTKKRIVTVELTEDRSGNRYSLDGLAPGTSHTFPVYAHGELGYTMAVHFEGGPILNSEFYAESGYGVEHQISEDKIGYEPADY